MRITVLSENTSVPPVACEHGLSLLIETKEHKLLFDTGAGPLFAGNAQKLNVDLSGVDIAVISHGHYDHGGGLAKFLDINASAPVYIRENAFGDFFSERTNGEIAYIGLEKQLLSNPRFILTGKCCIINKELRLFSDVAQVWPGPSGNKTLLKKTGEGLVPDDFTHEQSLIISAEGKSVLISGCAHGGILNILRRYYEDNGGYPDYVIGGFHMYAPAAKKSEPPEVVTQVGKQLMRTGAVYYTCHCTGIEPYIYLKTVMDDRIKYLSAGEQIII